jgi:hypothetical protein
MPICPATDGREALCRGNSVRQRGVSALLLHYNREAKIRLDRSLRRFGKWHRRCDGLQAPAVVQAAAAAGLYPNENDFTASGQAELDFTVSSPPHASRGMTGELQAHVPQIGIPHRLSVPAERGFGG